MNTNRIVDAWLAGEKFFVPPVENPTPRLQYKGDTHPCGDKVLRIDRWGLIEARREIAETSGANHPSLNPLNWTDLRGVVS